MANTPSWSDGLKVELAELEIKNQCCRRALVFGLMFSAERLDSGDVILTVPASVCEVANRLIKEQFTREPSVEFKGNKALLRFNSRSARIMLEKIGAFEEYKKCKDCAFMMLRGMFISVGSMNSPQKESYMQFLPADTGLCLAAKQILDFHGLQFSAGVRRGKTYLYAKRRQTIEDTLAIIGATSAYFKYLEEGINKQTYREIVRTSNCLTGNMQKAIVSKADLKAKIIAASNADRLAVLPPELQQTAKLLIDSTESSLSALAARHVPPVSKSGLYHRLNRIDEILTEYENKIKNS